MRNLFFTLIVCWLLVGCQKDVTIVPSPQPQPQPHCQKPHNPGSINIDINIKPGHYRCNRCGCWVKVNTIHHCH